MCKFAMSNSQYASLPDFDMERDEEIAPYSRRKSTARTMPFVKSSLILLCGITFGSIFPMNLGVVRHGTLDLLETSGHVVVNFEFNETYPGPPTKESEFAWLDLLPDGLGVVQHKDIDTKMFQLSVFHQMHCLMTLRHAIYDKWNGTRHSHMTGYHTRHCIDYLRQAIMCSADTNIEDRPNMVGINVTTGWGQKKCRDYEKVKSWAERWRAYDGKIPSRLKLHNEESLH